jgi:hypothetical protein
VHEPKQESPIISTDDGMQIDRNDEQSRKAFDSIRISLESDSNVNEEMEEQYEKHPAQRTSISRLNVID